MEKFQWKRLIGVLLSLVLMLSAVPVPAHAQDGGISQPSSPETILGNCQVSMNKEGNFTQEDTGVDVSVSLDESVESCNLTIFAYAGNVSFDPDDSHNIRLWSGMVSDGYSGICNFSQQLQVGYRVIACLNVPVGEDNYRPVNSRSIEVVDESGTGFQDYDYPDAFIDEQELTEGATSLHISLTGDERLFEAAREGKTSIICAVGQYPDGESFDFEGENQISLASNIQVTEAFSGMEITLSEPLRAGYRVRAVVYWTQNTDLFLVKGNDYEASFGRPDDSVLVTGNAEEPSVSIEGSVAADDTKISVSVKGTVPEGSTLLMKSYDSGTSRFLMSQGTWVGSAFDLTARTYEVEVQEGSLDGGRILVAFVQNGGTIVAQSAPVTVDAALPFTVAAESGLAGGASEAVFTVTPSDSSVTNMNIVALCRVNSDGTADTQTPIARLFGQAPGRIAFENLPSEALGTGERVCLVITYANGDQTFQSSPFLVTAPEGQDSILIQETSFTTESTTVTVIVGGCGEFVGGRLVLTVGPEGEMDGDSRTQIGNVVYTGPDTYIFTIDPNRLQAGQTILPHLYKYDADTDSTSYRYGEPVRITAAEGGETESSVAIVTSPILSDREDVWVTAAFDEALTGTLKLYSYAGESYEGTEPIYSGTIQSSKDSQKISFGAGKLTAGNRLTAVLELSDGTSVSSSPALIQAAPQPQQPQVTITDKAVTAGDTSVQASFTFDRDAESASYMLYQFAGSSLDTETAQVLNEGNIYRSETGRTIYVGSGKLTAGSNLQIVFTVDGQEAFSNIVPVDPSPDWGTPYAAFDVSAVKTDAEEIKVTIDYSDEYLSLGDDFYCDVTIYAFSAAYTDDEFIEGEMWEQYGRVTRVGQVNSNNGQQTKGQITVPVRDDVTLNAGDRLIIKLRLPHTEWEGEEVDYLSASVPVISADDTVPEYKVVLYNLGEDTSRGERLKNILDDLGIPVETAGYEQLGETVGYLAGLEGYSPADEAYTGEAYTTEFMLMCSLPESLLDRFLSAMTEAGLRIDHKAVVTQYNREYKLWELIGDISEEHDVFQALLALDDMISAAEALSEDTYGEDPGWTGFREALQTAIEVLSSYEPSLEELQTACDNLKEKYLSLTGMKEMTGRAVIAVSKEEDGTYTLTAGVQGGTEGTDYQYSWSTGEQTRSITGKTATELIAPIVTITAPGMYGKLQAQLQVPDKPEAAVTIRGNSLELSWKTGDGKENQPAPESCRIQLYRDGELVKTEERDSSETGISFDDLDYGTAYTVKLWAVSPVGRSDMAILTASIPAEGFGGNPDTEETPETGESETPETETPESGESELPGEEETSGGGESGTPEDSGTAQIPGGGSDTGQNSGGTQDGAQNTTGTDKTADTPATGDGQQLYLWAALLLSAAVLAGLSVRKKRTM